jgi:hypothetical protein
MRLKHARAILGYHLPPFIPSARAVVRAFSFGDTAAEALRALSRRKRVSADPKHDRNRRGGSFGGEGGGFFSDCRYYRDPAAHGVSRKCMESTTVAARPSKLDAGILPFDDVTLPQAAAEYLDHISSTLRRRAPRSDTPDR